MHTFQKTFDTLKRYVMELKNEMNLLKSDLDRAIEHTWGPLGTFGNGNSHLFHLTYCNLEESVGDMCIFTPKYFVISHAVPDHTYGSKEGHVFYDSQYTYVSTLTSSVFQPADHYCIRFYFKLNGVTPTGSIKLYLQVGDQPGYPFHTIPSANLPAKKWILAEASPDQEYLQYPFKIILENTIRTYTYFDDFMVYNVPCNTDGIHSPVCPFGSFIRKEGTIVSCYTFHPEPLVYFDAIKSCKRVWPGASLLQIEEASEQTFITHQINNSTDMTYAADFGIWLGGNDIDTEHTFVWIGNENPVPFNFTNWHQGQPNNMNGDQDCVMLQYKTSSFDYEWGDVGCQERHSFICEMTYDARHAPSHHYANTVIG
ncbi:uncharacterized protein LOC125677178 [Ostrea edulis]|uniref:uncharacterized protein LOC125677178 n=1 Tax=Ostrea edulis TaxID=37623 RepID=UPI0024B000FF|nr:uncharacterized protein LOC125677178 [Ostrea edulis]